MPSTTSDPTRTAVRPPAGPQRLLAGWSETGQASDLSAHLARHGQAPWDAYHGTSGRHRLIDEIERSGLRGRGGAGFPTGRKLAAVAAGGRRAVVVANGCEGDPASGKDRALLNLAPHLVLDGLTLAGVALDAEQVVLCLHRGDPLLARVRAAVAERVDDPLQARVAEIPRRYVASEESALVNFLNTGEARPTSKPPRPYERGVRRRPTLVSNVETYAHLALIARYGADWFRTLGTPDSPGTTLLTLGGAVAEPGVYEVPFGTAIGAALQLGGGGTEDLQAVLVGGLGGSWLPLPGAAEVPLAHRDLKAAGTALGIASLVALPARACGLTETARITGYLAEESASQCGPCMFGLPAVAADLAIVADGRSHQRSVADRLRRRLGLVNGRGACGHPDGAVRLTASALHVFGADVATHLRGHRCRWSSRTPVVPVPPPGAHQGGWR